MQNSVALKTNGKSRGTRVSSELRIIRTTDAPAVIVETGFISSNTERTLLKSEAYQDMIAEGIIDGIMNYLQK